MNNYLVGIGLLCIINRNSRCFNSHYETYGYLVVFKAKNQRFFSSVLLLELIFLLLYVWVRVTSRFPLQLVILVSFLKVSSHWRRWTNSVNLLIWRLEGSVQSDSFFLWKLLKLFFPLLFSLGLIIAMLSLLAVLRFSLIKSRGW